MSLAELRDKTPDQLKDEILKLKKLQFNLRFQKATGQLENTAQVGNVRREIARAKTILAQKAAAGIVAKKPAKLAAPAKTKTAKPKAAKPKAVIEKAVKPKAEAAKAKAAKATSAAPKAAKPKSAKPKAAKAKSATRKTGSK